MSVGNLSCSNADVFAFVRLKYSFIKFHNFIETLVSVFVRFNMADGFKSSIYERALSLLKIFLYSYSSSNFLKYVLCCNLCFIVLQLKVYFTVETFWNWIMYRLFEYYVFFYLTLFFYSFYKGVFSTSFFLFRLENKFKKLEKLKKEK